MAYFNHAFRKTFLGGGEKTNGTPFNVVEGLMISDSGVSTTELAQTAFPSQFGGTGRFWGIFNANTYESVELFPEGNPECCPIIIASQSIFANDKIGPFAGGYKETNKSKAINAKYVSQVYRVDPCRPQANVIHVGTTPYTNTEVPDPKCCKPFLCDETYYLRLDLKGSPALRFLTRNSYYTADYYTGCCADDTAPTAVDPTLVYIGWAKQFKNSPLIKPFINIIVWDTIGESWYENAEQAIAYGGDPSKIWDNYVSPAGPYEDLCAGFTILGAYVDTIFGNCTFYPTDFFQKEPIRILASEVDYTGDPCLFTGICVVEECPAIQGNGFGDTVLKDLILSESYRQNYFATNMDLRIREVTQGYDISSAVDRTAFYTRFYILHNVPRFNNPTGVFDNDQYLLEIVVEDLGPDGGNIAPGDSTFEAFMTAWLQACNSNCAEVGYYGCQEPCEPVTAIPSEVIVLTA